MKTRRISLWAGRQANLIPASFYKNLCGLCGNLFMYVNLSECHFHRVGVGYCECSDFAAAFTEFEDLAIAAG